MLRSYVKVVQRKIFKQPLHTTLNLSCLTIGIVGALLILLYLDFELTYDRYHAHSDRIYRVATSSIKTHDNTIDVMWNSTPAPLGES
jgi:putative ABC transport system permease protein